MSSVLMRTNSSPPNSKPESRLQRFRRRIREQYWVRFHMMLILSATAFSGVLASRALLWCGIGSVKVRYPLNVAIAYLVFLLLVRLWIAYVHSGNSGVNFDIDAADAAEDVIDLGGSLLGEGGGGSSVSSSSLSSSALPSSSLPSSSLPSSGGGSSSSGGGGSWFSFGDFSFDLDGDGVIILIVLAILILVIVSAGAYLIWAAPEILGEAAFNALLAANLVKVSSRLEREGWIEGTVRATAVPFGAVLLMTVVLAFTVHSLCPPAATIREALSCPVPDAPR